MARQFLCSETEPVVGTKNGRLRGFQTDGTYVFQGVRYASAKRFLAPEPEKPWTGVRDALSYGYVCPLLTQEKPWGELLIPHRYWLMDEDCLSLNIWTQTLDAGAKRPVMVWLHGGGFAAGSSIEHVAYDGEALSRFGGTVVVSLNHRLNVLGYLDLSPFGEKYRNSANAGNDDIVEALRWIRENIEAFGGDPQNVTLFGQSGGGMKIWALMQTPAADGLFHKAVIQSGVIADRFVPPEGDGREIVSALLRELGLPEGGAEKLETVPYRALADAYNKVSPGLAEKGCYVGCWPLENEFYLGDPRKTGFREAAKKIPVLIGTAFGEFAFGPGVPGRGSLPEDKREALVRGRFGAAADGLISLFRAAYPERNLTDLLVLDTVFRAPTIDFVEKRAQAGGAPVYSYEFAYEFACSGGKPAWHCSEIPFVFHNTDKVPVCNEPGVSDLLEEQLSGAWVNFARAGTPEHPSLPAWPACRRGCEETMIFDRRCGVRRNFDHELIARLEEAERSAPPAAGDTMH